MKIIENEIMKERKMKKIWRIMKWKNNENNEKKKNKWKRKIINNRKWRKWK